MFINSQTLTVINASGLVIILPFVSFIFSDEGVANKIALVQVDASEVTMGKPRDYPTYGWDCEYPQVKKRYVEGQEI